jgi:DNA-binding LacI/PurR family transcriptional regulator
VSRVRIQPGARPTREDVARRANISGSTVSRVLSGRTDLQIAPETRARVLEAAAELGYQPNAAARALQTGRTGLIGFWMSLHYSRYRAQVLDRMRALLGATDLAMSVTDIDEEYHWNHTFARALRTPVDGIIAFDNSATVEAFGREHDRLAPRLPFVSMGAYWSEAQNYVGVDLTYGAEAAMDYLIGQGRRRIAYLAPGGSDLFRSGIRYDVYLRKLAEAGLEPIVIGVANPAPMSAIGPLREAGTIDGVLCLNDDYAIGAGFALDRLGVRVGEDVLVVGFDGIDEVGFCPFPVATIKQPVDEMCRLAVQILRMHIEYPEAPLQQKMLRPELVVHPAAW